MSSDCYLQLGVYLKNSLLDIIFMMQTNETFTSDFFLMINKNKLIALFCNWLIVRETKMDLIS